MVTPSHALAGTERRRKYNSKPLATSALEGDGWLAPRYGHFTPENKRFQLYRTLGGPRSQSGWTRKISPQHDSIPKAYRPQQVATPPTLSHEVLDGNVKNKVHSDANQFILTSVYT